MTWLPHLGNSRALKKNKYDAPAATHRKSFCYLEYAWENTLSLSAETRENPDAHTQLTLRACVKSSPT